MTVHKHAANKPALHQLFDHLRQRLGHSARHAACKALSRPRVAAAMLLACGVALGAGARTGVDTVRLSMLEQETAAQAVALAEARTQSQREINALAARLGELQAQANRLNALGERLAQAGDLEDGEFDFDAPVGIGGAGTPSDMPAGELRGGMARLDAQLRAAGSQLSVMEAMMLDRKLAAEATPSRTPIAHSYITSSFGRRADPFGGGGEYHRGIDFHANTGDPVLAVADGVVSYAGVRSGYGNVVEIDHGNGYVTRYAHNSRLLVRVGDLVRAGGQVARAGSSGRSTGAHVHFEVWDHGRVVNPRKFLGSTATQGHG